MRGIYRGPGGTGDAVADTSNQSQIAVSAAADAVTSKNEAAASASASASSATASANSASASYNSSVNSYNAALNAASSASSASNSAISAGNSAASASNSSDSATTQATLAQNWAIKTIGPVSGSEYSAKYNAQQAATSASNASASEIAAATSAATASTKASDASLSATNAASSASAASTSASNAATSEANALSSKNAAATSETNAASSATSANTSASTATTQATNSASSAGAAATSASAASSSQSAAATSATNAASSASAAATSASTALTAQTATETARDTTLAAKYVFDDTWLGSKASDPTVNNHGNTLIVGSLYYNSVDKVVKTWTGTIWQVSYATLSGAMSSANNLSDVASVSAARSNLGLGTLATQNASSVTVGDLHTTGNTTIDGNLTVSGTTTTINATNLDVSDNMIYLNNGSTTANPDIGVAGNYNDGTYRHTGFFRDATDGRWKFFHQYTPEPDASVYIDTAHASFALAEVQASNFYGTFKGNADTVTNGVVTTGSYSDPTWITSLAGTKITGNISGQAGSVYNGVYTTDVGSVTNTMLAGSIANGKLVNSSITVNGTVVSLGGSVSVGTVTSVTATGPLSVATGTTTPALSIAQANTTTSGYLSSTDWNTFNNKQAAFGSQTANTFYAAPNGSAGAPVFRTIVAADIPTLNQNTTGSSGSCTGAAASTPLLQTANFSISEVAGKLVIKYGATVIASISSTGAIVSANNVSGYGTP